MGFVDTHTHLLDERLRDRANDIAQTLGQHGLDFVVETSADPSESHESLEFATRHKNVYCTLGVHPHYAEQYDDKFEEWTRTKVPHEKVVAIGECGLDYYHDKAPREKQREIFIKQIKLAHELGLPLVVHSRDAFDETYKILLDHRGMLGNGVLIHCYSYGVSEVKKFGELDAYFAFGGAITYKNAIQAKAAIQAAPINRLVLETDCPYLSPVPLRGETNEPKNIQHIAAHVAQVLNTSPENLAEITTQNAKRFFKIN